MNKKPHAANVATVLPLECSPAADTEWAQVFTVTAPGDSPLVVCPEALGIMDSGCQKTVMGLFHFRQWEKALLEQGALSAPPMRQDADDVFQFGNRGQLKALFAVEMPVSVYGIAARLRVCIVAGHTPLLLSRDTMSKLGLSINFCQNTVSSHMLDLVDQPILEVGGHLVLDLMSDGHVNLRHAYKSDGTGAGVFMSRLTPQAIFGGAKVGSTDGLDISPQDAADQWFQVGHFVVRIHHEPRTSLFFPYEVQDVPCACDMLLPDRITYVQHDGQHELNSRHDTWNPRSADCTLGKPWTGCTVFVHAPHDFHGVTTTIDDLKCLLELESHDDASPVEVIKRMGLWPLPPTDPSEKKLADVVSQSPQNWSPDVVSQSPQKRSPDSQATSSNGLQSVAWVTPELGRIVQTDATVWSSIGSTTVPAHALRVESHGNSVICTFFPWNLPQEETHKWSGESWVWMQGLGKRRLFAGILKHTTLKISPRELRRAFKQSFPHGLVETRAVPVLLVKRPTALPALQVTGTPRTQGRLDHHDDSAPQVRCRLDQRESEGSHCQGVEVLGSQAVLPGGSSSMPVGGPDPDEESRADLLLQAASDCGDRPEQVRRDASSPSRSLDCSMQPGPPTAHATIDGARQDDQTSARGGAMGRHHGRPAARSHDRHPSGGDGSASCLDPGSSSSGEVQCSQATPDGQLHSEQQVNDESERDMYTTLLGNHSRIMTKGDVQDVTLALETQEMWQQDLQCLQAQVEGSKSKAPVLLEVFSGSMHLSLAAASRGWTVLEPCDVLLGTDLMEPRNQAALVEDIKQWSPDLVTWAPPCGPYSPLQQIMPRNPKKRYMKVLRLKRKRQRTNKLWKFCHGQFHDQGEVNTKSIGDGQVLHMVENPLPSAAWNMFKFTGHAARVDQCAFGLKLKPRGLKVKKATRLQCNHQGMAQGLNQRCRCPHPKTGPRHDHIISGDRVGSKWQSRSARCATWPMALCHHMLAQAEEAMGWTPPRDVMTAVNKGTPNGDDSVFPYEVFAEEVGEEDGTPHHDSEIEQLV